MHCVDVMSGGSCADDGGLRPAKPPRLTSPDQLVVVGSDHHSSTPTKPADGCTTPVAVPLTVSLLSAEPDVGLGFDVTGDQTGAVFVGDVFESGPAEQTGKIRPGEYTSGTYLSLLCLRPIRRRN